jgi:transcriptional regulator with XRE-family HTH domain
MSSRPLWLFDSPLLRQALAQVDLPAVPAIVRAACGLSQRDLAAIVGWSPAALSYYERGVRDGMFDIRTALQFADAVGMPRAALLPLVCADPDASLAADTEDGTGMDLSRRDFGGLAVAAGVAAVVPAVSGPRGVTSSHVRYWQACTDVLYARDRAVGGTILLSPALQQWQRVRLALKDGTAGETGRQFLAVAGELALCTGWIALDSGRPSLARPLYEEARELAAGAGDVVLAVHVLTSQSMLSAEMARTGPSREPARQALRLAFQAQEEGRYIPMAPLHALIALRHASAASLLGDKTAFQAAIIQARRELDRGPRDGDPPEWLRFVDAAEVTGVEARGWLNLGDAHRSERLYRQVLAAGLSTRNRVSYGAGLADALLKQGSRQDAVAAAMGVLPALEGGVTSTRCLNRLRIVRQAAGDTAGAREFCERFDAVERTLAASCNLPGQPMPVARADIPALCRGTGFPAWPGTRFIICSAAVSAALDGADEVGPCLRPDGQAGTVRVLRVAYQAVRSGLGDLDAVVASGAVAGFAPWPGEFRVLRGGHCCSLASTWIMAADPAGSRAWVTRWVQARVNRSTSSAASTYTSPISPST